MSREEYLEIFSILEYVVDILQKAEWFPHYVWLCFIMHRSHGLPHDETNITESSMVH